MDSSKFSKRGDHENPFSDEKFFDINGVNNAKNDREWAIDRADADLKGGIKQKRNFPQKIMAWLGACSKGLTPLVIFDGGTVNHAWYIDGVLPVALKYGNQVLGGNWTFQQDGAKSHTHHSTQQWCRHNFPSFLDKDQWPLNSPDLNPLDYSIWNELVTTINWDKFKSKTTLIDQFQSSVRKIRESVVFDCCAYWTNRLYPISLNDGDYLC